MPKREKQNNWAEQVPSPHRRGPYRDYGWDPGQSVLPEFRDPNIDFMPYERAELEPWQQSYPRHIVNRNNPSHRDRGAWRQSTWYQAGPYTGRGPRNYLGSDERIFEEICQRMTQHGELDASDIEVQVSGGDVTLSGSVPDRRTKRLAEDISDMVFGVQDVHNDLQVQRKQGTPDRWRDQVGKSGVYPASEAQKAPEDSEAQGMMSWGQGERGAEGYYDHGESELHVGPQDEGNPKS